MSKTYLFVYGTLMRNHRANSYLINEKYIGKAITKENHFSMVSCGGAYPMVFNNGDKKIAGEVYEIDESIIRYLDVYEGCDNSRNALYKRDYFDYVLENGKEVKAIMYYQDRNIHQNFYMDNVLLENDTYRWR